jgi:hypothetical protein
MLVVITGRRNVDARTKHVEKYVANNRLSCLCEIHASSSAIKEPNVLLYAVAAATIPDPLYGIASTWNYRRMS